MSFTSTLSLEINIVSFTETMKVYECRISLWSLVHYSSLKSRKENCSTRPKRDRKKRICVSCPVGYWGGVLKAGPGWGNLSPGNRDMGPVGSTTAGGIIEVQSFVDGDNVYSGRTAQNPRTIWPLKQPPRKSFKCQILKISHHEQQWWKNSRRPEGMKERWTKVSMQQVLCCVLRGQ